MGFSLLSHPSRLLHCACTVLHLLQTEEPRHLCNLVLLDEHLTVAGASPQGRGDSLGPLPPGFLARSRHHRSWPCVFTSQETP